MALPATGPLLIGGSASNSIQYEVWRSSTGVAGLDNLSVAASKSAPHGMSEFYGFNGLMTLTLTQTFTGSDPGGNQYRSVQMTSSNILARTAGFTISRKVSVFRHSTGSPPAGSIYAQVRTSISSAGAANGDTNIAVVKLTTQTGTSSLNDTKTGGWTSSSYLMTYIHLLEPTPYHICNISYASISISSFYGQCYSTSSGSPKAYTT